jgi:hypothetical protein
MLRLALFIFLLPVTAFAQCAGNGVDISKVPFTCAQGDTPTLADRLLGGQSNRTVQFTVGQLIGIDHSLSPITGSNTQITLTLANVANYLTGAALPYPMLFGSSVTLNADPVNDLQAATKQYVDVQTIDNGPVAWWNDYR